MASMRMEKKGKQESKRDLGRKLVIWREAEALGKQSSVFEAEWRSRGPVLQHSPGAGPAQEEFPGAPTHPWHTLSCSQLIPHPALPQPCPKAGPARSRASHRGHQGWSPSQDTTAHAAKSPFSSNPLLFSPQLGLDHLANMSGCLLNSATSWFPLPLSSVLMLTERDSNRGSCTQIWTKF